MLQFLDSKTTKKLLKQARVQQQQLEDELAEVDDVRVAKGSRGKGGRVSDKTKFRLVAESDEEDEEEFNVSDNEENDEGDFAKQIVRNLIV